MTLEEKFEELSFDIPSEDCVKIAEDFAIGFKNWCIENRGKHIIFMQKYTDTELLEIYKKEKGL